MLLLVVVPIASASGMTCDDVCNMLALNIPSDIVARNIAATGAQAELVASCPEARLLIEEPRKARRADWKRCDDLAPVRTPVQPQQRRPYRPLPRWVRPGIEIVPAAS